MIAVTATVRSGRHAPGGALIGLSIAAMHATGMAAFRIDGIVPWDRRVAAASVLPCVAPGVLALTAARSRLRSPGPHARDPAARARGARLRQLGVELALDDSGVGHALLDVLRHLPATRITLDASVMAEIEHSGRAVAILDPGALLGSRTAPAAPPSRAPCRAAGHDPGRSG